MKKKKKGVCGWVLNFGLGHSTWALIKFFNTSPKKINLNYDRVYSIFKKDSVEFSIKIFNKTF